MVDLASNIARDLLSDSNHQNGMAVLSWWSDLSGRIGQKEMLVSI